MLKKIQEMIVYIMVLGVILSSIFYNCYAEDEDDVVYKEQTQEEYQEQIQEKGENLKEDNNTTGENESVEKEEETSEVDNNENNIAEPNKESGSNSKSYENTNNSNKKSSSSNNITVKKSDNANLATLGINPNDFKGFKAGITSYEAIVPNNIESITVYATAQDKNATISGLGIKNLNVGKNEISVVVTAEDGKQKTYIINVTREDVVENVKENIETKSVSDLIKLEVEGYSISPAFLSTIYEYTVNVKDDVTSLNVITECSNDKINVQVAGNTDLQDGENVITVLVTNLETKESSTYQIIVKKIIEEENDAKNRAILIAKRIRISFFAIVALIILISIFVMVRRNALKKEAKKNEIYDYDEDDIDKINLDEDDFFNRVNKEKLQKKVFIDNEYDNLKKTEDDKFIDKKKNNSEFSENLNNEYLNKDNSSLIEEHFRIKSSKNKPKHY